MVLLDFEGSWLKVKVKVQVKVTVTFNSGAVCVALAYTLSECVRFGIVCLLIPADIA